jgi:hypothetical protein
MTLRYTASHLACIGGNCLLRCRCSNQIPTLPHRAIQSVLAHSRRIKPARLKLARRALIIVVKTHDRLAGSIVAFPASEIFGPVRTQTATWVVATTARTGLSVPLDREKCAESEI